MARGKKNQKFLAANPWCCFCGGGKPATTIDHVPARSLFLKRHWPESYEFPACWSCNDASKTSEIVVAAISRCFPDPKGDDELSELRKLVEGIQNNDPATLDEMTDPSFQVKIARSNSLIVLPQGFVEELPVLRIGSRAYAHFDAFAIKLAKALYYLHTGNIVSGHGRILKRVYSNSHVMLNGLPVAYDELPAAARLERNTQKVNDQFEYRYGVVSDRRRMQFTAWFRQAFVVAATVNDRHRSSSDAP